MKIKSVKDSHVQNRPNGIIGRAVTSDVFVTNFPQKYIKIPKNPSKNQLFLNIKTQKSTPLQMLTI